MNPESPAKLPTSHHHLTGLEHPNVFLRLSQVHSQGWTLTSPLAMICSENDGVGCYSAILNVDIHQGSEGDQVWGAV